MELDSTILNSESRLSKWINSAQQLEAALENLRFHPSIVLAGGDITLGFPSQDVERDFVLPAHGLNQPILGDIRPMVEITQRNRVLMAGGGADHFQHHVRRPNR